MRYSTTYSRASTILLCLAVAGFAGAQETNFDALLAAARTHLAAEEFDAALSSLDAAEALRPGAPEVAYGRGIALAALGHTDEATAVLEALVAIDPAHAAGWALLGQTLVQRGDLGSLLRATGGIGDRPLPRNSGVVYGRPEAKLQVAESTQPARA